MTRQKILIVDDEPNNLKFMQQILQDEYDLLFATGGEKALVVTRKMNPDLILLDIMMPDLDGYTVCIRLKEDETCCDIPVIFVTGKAEVEDERKGFEVGAVDYLNKPVSAAVVKARVRNHLLLKHQKDLLTESISLLQHEADMLQHKAELGLLAGGLAHDINNILAVAMFFEEVPDLIPEEFEEREAIVATCEMVKDAFLTGRQICQGFTSYLHGLGEERKEHAFFSLIQPVDMFRKVFRGEVVRSFCDEEPHILCKGSQVKRVIVNLFVNASQAVEAREEKKITLRLWREPPWVCFSIHDNGPGIPEHVLPHIFEERFTTKAGGTGLGLHMAKGIVEAHGGSLGVLTVEGEGTTFVMRLPEDGP
ncbi:hypothetical protein DSLASN_23420 [Desulfoluna limicola]|uniref:histidine kinase n=1 Tax=Desulfoluna limicola TaxID=2810562 RepID=A0ABN6F655_9BACT|nr:hybrid sensor histidine kinase/response regulator [Desulfoluna limicola]BCS96710.1 hypothetical protein DSLASN_23420 [Desulfoluna limicola]